MVRHLLGDLDLAAVAGVFGDAGCTERVIANLRPDSGLGSTAADHVIGVRLTHRVAGEQPGTSQGGREEDVLGAAGSLTTRFPWPLDNCLSGGFRWILDNRE